MKGRKWDENSMSIIKEIFWKLVTGGERRNLLFLLRGEGRCWPKKGEGPHRAVLVREWNWLDISFRIINTKRIPIVFRNDKNNNLKNKIKYDSISPSSPPPSS